MKNNILSKAEVTIVLREAGEQDVAGMVRLLAELFAIEADFSIDAERQRQGLATLLANPAATVFVAEAEQKIVGMCTLQPLISTAEGGTVGLVEDMVVDDAWRGRGIGGRLLAAIEDTARRQGMSRLQLLRDSENGQAAAFYRKHGWRGTQLLAMRKLLD